MTKDHLTSEYLKQIAPSAFEVAHLAIEVTKAFIKKGHQVDVNDILEMLRHRTAAEIIADIDDGENSIS